MKDARLTCRARLRQASAVALRALARQAGAAGGKCWQTARQGPVPLVQPVRPVRPVVCGRGNIEPGCDELRKRTVWMPKIALYRTLSQAIAGYRTLKNQGWGTAIRQDWVHKLHENRRFSPPPTCRYMQLALFSRKITFRIGLDPPKTGMRPRAARRQAKACSPGRIW